MNKCKPKFQLGQIVYNKTQKKGSYEPSICRPYTQLQITKMEIYGDTIKYTCGYNGYEFWEDELLSVKEYFGNHIKTH